MGVLRHSYFFADLQTILQEYGLACKNFFNLYNKLESKKFYHKK